ncbi:hypothetical protein B0H11DRAFT_145204 [Mycena galericulata]|nr:hypothetical protein B0H11DRAFT_145204 [Mycena galericulata]
MPDDLPFTDFSRFVLDAIKSTKSTGTSASSMLDREALKKDEANKSNNSTLDQEVIRTALAMSSSFLITDTSTNPDPHAGYDTWYIGLNRLVDLLVALHAREELDIETINVASKACSECWTVAGTWRELEQCREGVRKVGAKLAEDIG